MTTFDIFQTVELLELYDELQRIVNCLNTANIPLTIEGKSVKEIVFNTETMSINILLNDE